MSQEEFETSCDTMKNKVGNSMGSELWDFLKNIWLDQVRKTLNDDELKEVYALYKQATFGDVNIEKPGMMDLKWEKITLQFSVFCFIFF